MPATIPQVAALIQEVLGPVADAAARASGFTRRASKLTGAVLVQTLVFGWLTRPEAGLERLCQVAARLGVRVTRQGLDARFTFEAAACLEQVLVAAVRAVVAATPVALPLLARFPGGVWVQDSTTIALPDALAARWPGCGGSGPTAALKLQVRLDLVTGVLDGPLLTPGRAQDRASPHQQQPLPPGSLRLADLGFFSLATLRAGGAAGNAWLSRLPTGTIVFADGQRWDRLSRLLAAATLVDRAVEVGVVERLPARLLAAPVPQEVADQRRRRVREDARKKGKAANPERLALCDWTVVITNLPPDRLSLREALVLTRVRWQVELLFKLWKSHHAVDAWRSANPARILCEVYAKLIGIIVQHWLLLVGGWSWPDRSLAKAAQTIQDHLAALTAAVRRRDPGRLAAVMADIAHDLAGGCRLIRRRGRPSTYHLVLALDAVPEPIPARSRPRRHALAHVA